MLVEHVLATLGQKHRYHVVSKVHFWAVTDSKQETNSDREDLTNVTRR